MPSLRCLDSRLANTPWKRKLSRERNPLWSREKFNDLAAIEKALKGLITECSKGSRKSGCPIIDALAAER